jgi:hypothetical protein
VVEEAAVDEVVALDARDRERVAILAPVRDWAEELRLAISAIPRCV